MYCIIQYLPSGLTINLAHPDYPVHLGMFVLLQSIDISLA